MEQWNGFDSLDLSDVEAGENFLKLGQYRCDVTKASVEPTKNSMGLFVQVEMTDVSGSGKTVDRFNVKNSIPKAVEIGLSQLKKFLIEANHPNPDKPGDISSLVGLKVGVNIEQGGSFTDNQGNVREGRGEIAGYFKEAGVNVSGPAPTRRPEFKGQSNAPVNATVPAAGSDKFDDDIPF